MRTPAAIFSVASRRKFARASSGVAPSATHRNGSPTRAWYPLSPFGSISTGISMTRSSTRNSFVLISQRNGPVQRHGAVTDGSSFFRENSRQNAGDRLALDQLARLVQVVVDDRRRVDADRVVDRRQKLARMDRVLQRGRGCLVRLAP